MLDRQIKTSQRQSGTTAHRHGDCARLLGNPIDDGLQLVLKIVHAALQVNIGGG
jgi:hypothetical protein